MLRATELCHRPNSQPGSQMSATNCNGRVEIPFLDPFERTKYQPSTSSFLGIQRHNLAHPAPLHSRRQCCKLEPFCSQERVLRDLYAKATPGLAVRLSRLHFPLSLPASLDCLDQRVIITLAQASLCFCSEVITPQLPPWALSTGNRLIFMAVPKM